MAELNAFKLRKWAGLFIACFIPTLCFYSGVIFGKNIFIAVGLFLVGSIVGILVASFMIYNPFTAMLEGAGILCIDLSSVGIIRPFIVQLQQPYIKGKIGADSVNDVYDRATVMQIAAPVQAGRAIHENGLISIVMDENEFNRARFGMLQYPTLLYNSQIKSLITKDFLSNLEKTSFAEHGVLYLNRKMEELTSSIRDFGRYIVEQLKPQGSWLSTNKWVIWFVIIGVIILLALFARPVFEQIMGGGQKVISSVAGNNNPVVPR